LQRRRDLPEKREESEAVEDRTRDSLRATEDMLAKRKLTGFAERKSEGQAGSPAVRREAGKAEIDLVPKPDLRRFGRRKGESSREDSPYSL
jgi:hypothetical protein